MALIIKVARVPQDMEAVRELFIEYQQWLNIDFGFQGFEEELATLPGKYAEPSGRILMAWDGNKVAGGVALRPLDEDGICELKRLFVREGWRGQGLGRWLTSQILDVAKQIGYARIRLDTEKRLEPAIKMYQKFGFSEVGRYYDNPLEDILYMEKKLT